MFNTIKSYLFDSAEEKKIKAQLESIRNIRAGLEKDAGPSASSSTAESLDESVDEEALEAQLAC